MSKPAESPSPSGSTGANTSRVKRTENKTPAKRGGPASTLGKKSSPEANRRAAVILEVLAGVRLPSEAAGLLSVSVAHYYLLERKALEGLVAGCESQPKGRSGPTSEQQLVRLSRQLEQCRRECQRQAALVRATQRAVGLPASALSSASAKCSTRTEQSGSLSGKRRRRRRPTIRALRAATALEKNSSLSKPAGELQQSPAAESRGLTEAAQEGH